MLILSFDIGIKNLAYSIIKYNNDKIEILEWNIINLLKDVFDKQSKCDHCTKNANFKTINGEFHLCYKHKNKISIYKPLSILKSESKLDKCCLDNCSKKVKYLCNGKKICSSHKVQLVKEYNSKYKLKKIFILNCKNFPINDLLLKIIHIFNEKYIHFLLVDKVLIELQPVLKGPKMKTISNHIYSYFLINGVCNNQLNMKCVKYVNASNKLKCIEQNNEMDISIYKNRKKLAILNTNYILNLLDDQKNIKKFNKSKKKDDLADCFLQCLYFLEKNHSYKLIEKKLIN
jgi:hypothetical protein